MAFMQFLIHFLFYNHGTSLTQTNFSVSTHTHTHLNREIRLISFCFMSKLINLRKLQSNRLGKLNKRCFVFLLRAVFRRSNHKLKSVVYDRIEKNVHKIKSIYIANRNGFYFRYVRVRVRARARVCDVVVVSFYGSICNNRSFNSSVPRFFSSSFHWAIRNGSCSITIFELSVSNFESKNETI